MRGIRYKFRKIQSVPMYDQIMDSYHLLIDDEMVEVPSKLFHKLFEEIKHEDDPFEKLQVYDGRMVKRFIDAIKSQSGPEYKQIYQECKDACRIAIKQGADKEIFKKATSTILMMSNMEDSVPAFEELIDKIYGELEDED